MLDKLERSQGGDEKELSSPEMKIVRAESKAKVKGAHHTRVKLIIESAKAVVFECICNCFDPLYFCNSSHSNTIFSYVYFYFDM